LQESKVAVLSEPAASTEKIAPAKMARSSGFVLLGTLAGRGLNFMVQVALSNLLGVKAFGTFTYCNLILNFVGTTCLGGFTHTSVRYLALARANKRPAEIRGIIRLALTVMGILTLIAGTTLFFFRHPIAERWIGKPEMAPLLAWIAAGLPAMVLLGWVVYALRGFRDVSAEAILRNLMQPLVLIILVAIMAGVGYLTLLGAVVALLTSIFIAAMIGIWRLQRHLPNVIAPERATPRKLEILKYAASIWLTRFSNVAIDQGDRLMIGALATLSQVGIYHAAFRIADFQTLAMLSFVPMFSTAIAEAHATGDRAALVHYYRMVVRWSLLVTMPICLGCLLFAKPILHIFGEEFVSGAPVLVIISLASLIDAGVGPAGQFLQMMGKQKLEMAWTATAAALAISLNFVLIPRYGAMGAAFGTGVAMAFLNVARLLALRKILGVFPYTLMTIKLLAVSMLAAGVTWLISPRVMWMQGLILAAIYAVGTICFYLDADDRRMLARIKGRLWQS
jgi:O-antigen/teichoic acid export membrane protein